MALLGGRAGRIDTGPKMEVKGKRPIPGYTPGPLWQNDGPKYGFKYTKLAKVRLSSEGNPLVPALPFSPKTSLAIEARHGHTVSVKHWRKN